MNAELQPYYQQPKAKIIDYAKYKEKKKHWNLLKSFFAQHITK